MNWKKIALPVSMAAVVLFLMGQGCVSNKPRGDSFTGPAGVFRSADGGESWQSISKLPSAEGVADIAKVDVYRLAGDPQDPYALYWASRGDGMFFSYDDGKTWQRPKGKLSSGFIYAVKVDPFDKCVIYASNGSVIFKTNDCSRSWEEVYTEARPDVKILSLDISPFKAGELYLATSNGDLLRSNDAGASWETVKRFGLSLAEVRLDKFNEGTIYAASRRGGLFKSTDSGATWRNFKKTIKTFSKALEYRGFYPHPNKADTLYWVSTYGILFSEDGGESWSPLELLTPPGSVKIYGFSVNPANDKEIYYSASSQSRSTLYKSEDGGISWMTKKLPSSQLPTVIYNSMKDGALYVGFSRPPKK